MVKSRWNGKPNQPIPSDSHALSSFLRTGWALWPVDG